ncbi:MAG: DUF2029 domain-containing protein [Chloroflexota bacterium]|nr:DUF2029 domain-containing protein [Chloroflexota bacterium]
MSWSRRWRATRGALTVAGFAYLFAAWLEIIPFTLNLGVPPGIDTFAYWMADPADPYRLQELGTAGAYLYSPVFAQLFSPMRLLSVELVYGLWVGASVAALWWMRVLWTVAFPPVLMELHAGNIHILYAAAIVAGMWWGAAWALPLLTKVTPGVGVVWFAVRREWRPLLSALGVTAGSALVSFAIDPSAWFGWADVLGSNQGRSLNMLSDQVPLLMRVGLAAVLVAWGSLTDRRWTIPVAVVLAMPIIWPGAAAVLVAVVSPRLRASYLPEAASSAELSTGGTWPPANGGVARP